MDQIVDGPAESVLIKAFAQSVVERDVQSTVDPADFVETVGQKFAPEATVFLVPGMQLGRFQKNRVADIGMRLGLFGQGRVGAPLGQFFLERRGFFTQRGQRVLLTFERLTRFFIGRFPGCRLGRGECRLGFDDLLAQLRQSMLGGVKIHQLADQPIEPGQLGNGGLLVRLFVAEVAIPVKDHPELGTPVANVVVADRPVAEESQRPAQRVADHCRADMADVHRFGHVRGRVVDDIGFWSFNFFDAQTLVGQRLLQPRFQKTLMQTHVDESGPGQFDRFAQIVEFDRVDYFLSHLARRASELFAKRHREVRLIIAETRVAAGANQIDHRLGRIGVTGKNVGKSGFQFGKNTHASIRLFSW